MRNATATKEKILTYSGRLFNTQGYKATSISDITTATGLTKGAIYRHFRSKESLEEETFLHLSQIMFANVQARIKARHTAPEKLRAVFHYFESYVSHPPVTGGCPLMNAAIESDDTDPGLRKKAIGILNILRDSVCTILKNGVRFGQLKTGINNEYYATVIIASLEGAIMMSKLRGTSTDIKHVVRHLENIVREIEL
jgi:TetR/AcrR family transcriptional repressor of nem operon